MINPGDERTIDGRVWVAEDKSRGCNGCEADKDHCFILPCFRTSTGGNLLIWKLKTENK